MGDGIYCGSCKALAINGRTLVLESAMLPCKEAHHALVIALISPWILSLILGPIAIFKALAAKKIIESNPQLSGYGKINAAIAISLFGMALWLLRILSRI